MRNELIKKITEEKIIAIIRGVKKDKLIPLVQAMYDGGLRLVEVTYDSLGTVNDDMTDDMIKMLSTYFKGKMSIGAGTVLTKKQVELTKKAGGEFIISPDTSCEIINKTRELDMVSIPGALTPSEIQRAYKEGADFVKLFPISDLGPDYVKAIKAPLSHIKILAVGGINPSNMKEYIAAGVCGFGIGSNIVDKNLVENNDYDKITELSKKYTMIVKS